MEDSIIQLFSDYQRGVARVFDSESGIAGEQVCGSGFFVSEQYILTCAHVIIQALKIPRHESSVVPKQKVWLDCPSLMPEPKFYGEVTIWKPCLSLYQNASYLDDIALLKLSQPIRNSPVMLIRLCEDLHNKVFKIWGFPDSNGKESNGTIRAEQATRNWLQLQVNPIAHPIYGGFSGAPLALEEEGGGYSIVGMINAEESNFNPDTQTGGQTGYAIGAKALAEIWLKQGCLISLLFGLDFKCVERAYKTSRRKDWSPGPLSTIEEIVQDLYSMDSKQYQYLKSFIFCLLTKNISESLKSNLRSHLTKTYDINLSDIATEYDRLLTKHRLKTEPDLGRISRLWLMLTEAGTTDQYQLETVYFIEDSSQIRDSSEQLTVPLHENLKVDDLTEHLVPLLSEIMENLPPHDQLWVEVFLPFKSLHLAPDCWMVKDEYEDEPYFLGSKFPVLIRVWERLSYKKPYQQSPRWKRIWENKKLDALCSEALMCFSLGRAMILDGLQQNQCSGCRSTLPLHKHPEKFSFLMREGVPIAIWTRLSLDQCESHEEYESLLESDLASLPVRLRALRNEGLTKKNHIARQISILWDDPTVIPDDAPVFSYPSDSL